MPAADRRAALDQVLSTLSALVPDGEAGRLAALAARLGGDRLRVLVAGEAKRGKSTVVNALIGRDVLPSGVTPLTAIATTLVHGTDEHAAVTFAAGPVQHRGAAAPAQRPARPGDRARESRQQARRRRRDRAPGRTAARPVRPAAW